MSYLREYGTNVTPQSEPIPGSSQVPNSAGGYSFPLDDWARLDRFLILGSEGGTYYINQRELTKQNAEAVQRCIDVDGIRAVNRIVEISTSGRSPKNDPALFALALASAAASLETRKLALNSLPAVARTGTHLLHFAAYVQNFRGWGRGLREAVANWYLSKEPRALAYQVAKYPQRDGWSQRDLLRLAHPEPPVSDGMYNLIFRYVTEGGMSAEQYSGAHNEIGDYLFAVSTARHVTDPKRAINLIHDHRLTREMINPALLNNPDVWEALLDDMPLTAMVRNLGNMSKVGLLKPMSKASALVQARLGSEERIQNARVHPLALLVALNVYQSGSGFRGSGSWTPVPQVIDALNEAFYTAFKFIEPSGKRTLLALDVSGSMSFGEIAGMPGITPAIGAAAMAMATARTEPQYHFVGFKHHITELPITASQRLDDVLRITEHQTFGGTDCALPMIWALKQKIEVDTFCVYTDSETWHGDIHPVQALEHYRRQTGIPAKLVVIGMEANPFTIADPNDGGMLDVVGFDTAAPGVIADFARA